MGSGALHVRLLDPEQRPAAERLLTSTLSASVRLEADPAALSARISDAGRVAAALAELDRAGVAVANFALGQPSLDEVFLALTGRPSRNGDGPDSDDAQEADR